MNYGLYLQRANPDQESSWLQEDKKFNAYKYGPEVLAWHHNPLPGFFGFIARGTHRTDMFERVSSATVGLPVLPGTKEADHGARVQREGIGADDQEREVRHLFALRLAAVQQGTVGLSSPQNCGHR